MGCLSATEDFNTHLITNVKHFMHCNVKQNATVMVDCIQMALDTEYEDQPCAKRPYSSPPKGLVSVMEVYCTQTCYTPLKPAQSVMLLCIHKDSDDGDASKNLSVSKEVQMIIDIMKNYLF